MLIVSVGMQKSGSAYIYNIINDLNVAAGFPDARTVKDKHKLDDIMQWHNNNVGKLESGILKKLLRVSRTEGRFVIKTHDDPTLYLSWLNMLGSTATIYIYRDPRDVLISASDHGKKIVAEGKNHTFAPMVDFNVAFNNVKKWVGTWKKYNGMSKVLMIRYEDLLSKPEVEIPRIMKHLKIDVPADKVKEILARYDKNNSEANMKGLHFNKGVSERYKDELSPEQLDRFRNELGAEIREMGYALN